MYKKNYFQLMELIIITVTPPPHNGHHFSRGSGSDRASELWSDGDGGICLAGSLLLHLLPPGHACLG